MAECVLTDFKRFFFHGLAAVLPTLLTPAIFPARPSPSEDEGSMARQGKTLSAQQKEIVA